jgi:hypothetical protein
MRLLARVGLLTALLTALLAQPAQARILGLPETLTTTHFQLHYDGSPAPPGTGVLHQQAADLAANLERAYTTFVTDWGYPAPLDDGDGLIDVYVADLTTFGAFSGLAFTDTGANQSSGYIYIEDNATWISSLAAHELFHLIQFGQWAPMDPWLLEGTAEWAGFRFLGFPLTVDLGSDEPTKLSDTLGAPDMSLSCSGNACGLEDYERGGYSRWHFYQYLTERFGGGVVNDVFDKAKTLNDNSLAGVDFLFATLADKGATLGDTFNDWTVANMGGDYQAQGLKGVVPPVHATIPTGLETGALATHTVAVNHLAARYLAFQRGTGSSTGPCYAATLTINVTMPFALGARPYFRWTGTGGTAIPLEVSGSMASVSVPWDTCSWPDVGLLSLPNPSITVDAAVFEVTGSIVVDTLTPVTATPPPPGTYTGPTVPAPDAEEPPTIAVYGPETLRVSKKKRVLRLVVFSSGSGQLEAELGTLGLGFRDLRAGNNDLRFTLPKNIVRSRALFANSQLTLTSLSSSGERGAAVTRKLLLTK